VQRIAREIDARAAAVGERRGAGRRAGAARADGAGRARLAAGAAIRRVGAQIDACRSAKRLGRHRTARRPAIGGVGAERVALQRIGAERVARERIGPERVGRERVGDRRILDRRVRARIRAAVSAARVVDGSGVFFGSAFGAVVTAASGEWRARKEWNQDEPADVSHGLASLEGVGRGPAEQRRHGPISGYRDRGRSRQLSDAQCSRRGVPTRQATRKSRASARASTMLSSMEQYVQPP
jgi:hypothetical protein